MYVRARVPEIREERGAYKRDGRVVDIEGLEFECEAQKGIAVILFCFDVDALG